LSGPVCKAIKSIFTIVRGKHESASCGLSTTTPVTYVSYQKQSGKSKKKSGWRPLEPFFWDYGPIQRRALHPGKEVWRQQGPEYCLRLYGHPHLIFSKMTGFVYSGDYVISLTYTQYFMVKNRFD
jgi:hypothetical protein